MSITVRYDDLIGLPFSYGGRGPLRFDCYGLVMEVFRRRGVLLPDFRSTDDQRVLHAMITGQMTIWRKLDRVEPHSVAVFRIGRLISHVGYVLDPGRFLHTWEGAINGALVERLSDWRQRLVGCYQYDGREIAGA